MAKWIRIETPHGDIWRIDAGQCSIEQRNGANTLYWFGKRMFEITDHQVSDLRILMKNDEGGAFIIERTPNGS